MIKKEKEREMHRRACVYVRIHTYEGHKRTERAFAFKSHMEIYNIYIKQIYIKNTYINIYKKSYMYIR